MRLKSDIDVSGNDLELVNRTSEAKEIDHMRDIVLKDDELYTVKLRNKEILDDHCCHLQHAFVTNDSSADIKVLNSNIEMESRSNIDASIKSIELGTPSDNLALNMGHNYREKAAKKTSTDPQSGMNFVAPDPPIESTGYII